uniref:Uncharacterized protein n=1 Tax=Oryza meridionalis TaxID=40149 RepID=A0A0E0ENV4_9ORYZ
MLRRETLVWTNLLNRSPAPASRSPMQHSNACNFSSLQITEFFWKALEMRDNFGNTIFFDKRSSVDSNRELMCKTQHHLVGRQTESCQFSFLMLSTMGGGLAAAINSIWDLSKPIIYTNGKDQQIL